MFVVVCAIQITQLNDNCAQLMTATASHKHRAAAGCQAPPQHFSCMRHIREVQLVVVVAKRI